MKKYIALSFFGIILTLGAFTNCGEGFSTTGLSQASVACFNKLRQATFPSVVAANCEILEDYSCERRIFSPDIATEVGVERSCGNVAGFGDVCLDVTVRAFNTEGAREPSSEQEFLPGGEYNREEIQCSNKKLKVKGVPVIQADGESVLAAFEGAVERCRARSVQ